MNEQIYMHQNSAKSQIRPPSFTQILPGCSDTFQQTTTSKEGLDQLKVHSIFCLRYLAFRQDTFFHICMTGVGVHLHPRGVLSLTRSSFM